MRILALEPYYGGSHRAFLDGWMAHSQYEWTLLTLPAYTWKWRMRHSAVTFADMLTERVENGESWDVLFCSDMLSLAEFRGLVPSSVVHLPAAFYFHENQLTYPNRDERKRDQHFAYTNITSALSADAVWFNSEFHRDDFLSAARLFLERMPDFQHLNLIDRIRASSAVHPPGIGAIPTRENRTPGPLHILWAARWEHDKQPELFFEALRRLKQSGIEFRMSVLGESFQKIPEVFAAAKREFVNHIDHWGFQKTKSKYEAVLLEADVAVSTANHEFFGIGMLEAVAAGAYPVVPRKLAYPEIFEQIDGSGTAGFFYDGSVANLASLLAKLSQRVAQGRLWGNDSQRGRRRAADFEWSNIAARMDQGLSQVSHR